MDHLNNEPGPSLPLPPVSIRRPLKRAHSEAELGDHEAESAGPAKSTVRTKATSACEKCRTRKSKCDFVRPSCGFCTKHAIPCIYAADTSSSPWYSSVAQILDAISHLTKLVVDQQSHAPQPTRNIDDENRSDDRSIVAQSPTPNQTRLLSQGVEAVLQWEILAPYRTNSVTFADLYDVGVTVSTHSMPTIEYQELLRLQSKYIVGVHMKNPILDLTDLHRKFLHVIENGLEWNTKSCLVALVCAIGAITQEYQDQPQSPEFSLSPYSPLPLFHSGSEPDLSMQFWSVAAKRLGFAIGQNDIEAVQCLFLAGVWYMHHNQPLQAWKYFNLAGNAWYLLNLTHPSPYDPVNNDSQKKSLTLMQGLYFTIWKSECELRLELDLPGSILETLDMPDSFPPPPNLSDRSWDRNSGYTERAWYYYLAEIAARHLFNHLLRTHFWLTDVHNDGDVRNMIVQADAAEVQLRDWYSALPPMFHFDIPSGISTRSHPDDLTQILRNRYLACRELTCRPFVWLCVHRGLDLDPQLANRVVQLANQSIQYCALKLSQVRPHVHQGTWFGLRNVLTSSLTFVAVHKAKLMPGRPLAQRLNLPDDWKKICSRAYMTLLPLWDVGGSGASEMRRIFKSALADVDGHAVI